MDEEASLSLSSDSHPRRQSVIVERSECCDVSSMNKLRLLKEASFGARVAEEETADLASYFVETDQWTRIVRGEIDVIRGEKGSGKSAIYSLLMTKVDDFFDRSILLVAAERPRGAPVFKDLVADPPTSEFEFIGMWKLYILTLIAQRMRDFGIRGPAAENVYTSLQDAGFLQRDFDLSGVLRLVRDYARRIIRAEAIEGGMAVDPLTGFPTGITGKITFREPSLELRGQGFVSADSLIAAANDALIAAGYHLWVLLDRLDVAFAETHGLERNALRALFRVYLDLAANDAIRLKIFLRSDIWKRITREGFREASHITKHVTLEWNPASLLNLVVRRLLKNELIIGEFKVDRAGVLRDFDAQREVFYRLFPRQVDQGTKKPPTFDWMVSRCADGSGKTAPRELIHLLTSIREKEIERLERGETPPSGEQIFDRSVFKEALYPVSETRLVQNLYAEYPDLHDLIARLGGGKTEQTTESLAGIWEVSRQEALEKAEQLVEVGFFQPRKSRELTTYWVPFLYRDGLNMIQGMAEEPELGSENWVTPPVEPEEPRV
jgi:hypothetical protein